MRIGTDLKGQLARVFQVLVAGEHLAQECALKQTALATERKTRSFFATQAQQERQHADRRPEPLAVRRRDDHDADERHRAGEEDGGGGDGRDADRDVVAEAALVLHFAARRRAFLESESERDDVTALEKQEGRLLKKPTKKPQS